MTTEPPLRPPGGPPVVLTKLPRPGAVLVRSALSPSIPGATCADVRPGPLAVQDGDGVRASLRVESAAGGRRVGSRDLPGMAAAVEAAADEGGADVVRFGDRAACRSLLPAPTVAAIERRLVGAAGRGGATLLTWTSRRPGDADRRTYDVVVDGPAGGER